MMLKFTHLSLILSLSACVATQAPTALTPQQLLLGKWTCDTESGSAQGIREYRPDGTFQGDDYFTLPPDEAGDQMIVHMITDGQWRIDANTLIDTIVEARVVGAEMPGREIAGEELNTIKLLFESMISNTIKNDPTSHSDILVLADETFTNKDRETQGTSTCSRLPQSS